MYWPLMEETITLKDRLKMAAFVLTSSRLTNGPKVREFEEKWSQWLGVKHSVFVNSGSSANYISIAALKIFKRSNSLSISVFEDIKSSLL